MTTHEILLAAKQACVAAALLTTEQKNEALLAMADALVAHTAPILAANAADVAAARESLSDVMIDRLTLTGMYPARKRAGDYQGQRPDGRDRDDIRKPPQCNIGCGGTGIQKRQCLCATWRERGFPLVTGDSGCFA